MNENSSMIAFFLTDDSLTSFLRDPLVKQCFLHSRFWLFRRLFISLASQSSWFRDNFAWQLRSLFFQKRLKSDKGETTLFQIWYELREPKKVSCLTLFLFQKFFQMACLYFVGPFFSEIFLDGLFLLNRLLFVGLPSLSFFERRKTPSCCVVT